MVKRVTKSTTAATVQQKLTTKATIVAQPNQTSSKTARTTTLHAAEGVSIDQENQSAIDFVRDWIEHLTVSTPKGPISSSTEFFSFRNGSAGYGSVETPELKTFNLFTSEESEFEVGVGYIEEKNSYNSLESRNSSSTVHLRGFVLSISKPGSKEGIVCVIELNAEGSIKLSSADTLTKNSFRHPLLRNHNRKDELYPFWTLKDQLARNLIRNVDVYERSNDGKFEWKSNLKAEGLRDLASPLFDAILLRLEQMNPYFANGKDKKVQEPPVSQAEAKYDPSAIFKALSPNKS